MKNKREIGDTGYLKEPYLGYRHCEIVDFEHATGKVVVELSSGKQITVYEDELE
jgi:hypothetical protein